MNDTLDDEINEPRKLLSLRAALQRFAPPALWAQYEMALDALRGAPEEPCFLSRSRGWREAHADYRALMRTLEAKLKNAQKQLSDYLFQELIDGKRTGIG